MAGKTKAQLEVELGVARANLSDILLEKREQLPDIEAEAISICAKALDRLNPLEPRIMHGSTRSEGREKIKNILLYLAKRHHIELFEPEIQFAERQDFSSPLGPLPLIAGGGRLETFEGQPHTINLNMGR